MNNVFTIEELFSGKVLHIPDYQRGYSWEKPQWTDFLEDLEYLAPGKHHYTGTVVLHEQGEKIRDEGGKSNQVFHLVDGQQRLTTVVLLLNRISAFFPSSRKTLVDGIRSSYVEFKNLNDVPTYKLVLNTDCHEFFVRNILTNPSGPQGPTIASHNRLREADTFFSTYLAKKKSALGEGFDGWLFDLYVKVTTQLKVCLYMVEDTSEVGVIFESMNNRGKQLSELEKVKNHLLYLASKLDLAEPHELGQRVNATWSAVFQKLMASDLNTAQDEDRLLRAHWLTVFDPAPREWAGSDSVKSKYNLRAYHGKHKAMLADLTKYVMSLQDAVVPFTEAFRPQLSSAFTSFTDQERERVIRASEKLRRIRIIAPFLPCLIATRLKYPDCAEKYERILQLCELYAFRVYRVRERRSDAGQGVLFSLGYRIYQGNVDFEEALRQIRHLALSYCSRKDLESFLKLDDEHNNWYDAKLKYILYEYEEHLAGKNGVKVSWDVFEADSKNRTIEHILPQTATADCWLKAFTAGQRRIFTHDLGNLCLTENNSSYGNKCFPEKKGHPGQGVCYSNANLYQERELANYTQWDESTLRERRLRIEKWFLKRWNLDDSDWSGSTLHDEGDEAEVDGGFPS